MQTSNRHSSFSPATPSTGRTRRRYSTNCAAPVRRRCCWNPLTSTAKMTKSLLLVDSALRITALGDTATIQALSANGAALLELLDGALPSGINNQRQPNSAAS